MTATQPRVLLTADDVERWQEELRVAKQSLAEQQKKVETLTRRIDSAMVFVTEALEEELNSTAGAAGAEKETPAATGVDGSMSMHDAIKATIQRAGRPLEPKEIATAIKSNIGFPERIRNSHPNYLYTALKRMTRKTRLHRDSKGRYTVPNTNEAA